MSGSLGVRSLEVQESWSLGIQEFEESGVRESEGPESRSSPGSGSFGVRRLLPEICCWDAPSDGFLEGKVAPRARNTGMPNSRPALSWARGGPAQAKFKHLLSALSGARKYRPSRDPGGSRRLRPEIRCWDAPSDGFLEGRLASRTTGPRNSQPTLSWAQGGPAQAQSNTYCRPSQTLGLGNCKQKSAVGGALGSPNAPVVLPRAAPLPLGCSKMYSCQAEMHIGLVQSSIPLRERLADGRPGEGVE